MPIPIIVDVSYLNFPEKSSRQTVIGVSVTMGYAVCFRWDNICYPF